MSDWFFLVSGRLEWRAVKRVVVVVVWSYSPEAASSVGLPAFTVWTALTTAVAVISFGDFELWTVTLTFKLDQYAKYRRQRLVSSKFIVRSRRDIRTQSTDCFTSRATKRWTDRIQAYNVKRLCQHFRLLSNQQFQLPLQRESQIYNITGSISNSSSILYTMQSRAAC